MEIVNEAFIGGLPTLEELKVYNKGSDVPPETAWIWGKNDEVLIKKFKKAVLF